MTFLGDKNVEPEKNVLWGTSSTHGLQWLRCCALEKGTLRQFPLLGCTVCDENGLLQQCW